MSEQINNVGYTDLETCFVHLCSVTFKRLQSTGKEIIAFELVGKRNASGQ